MPHVPIPLLAFSFRPAEFKPSQRQDEEVKSERCNRGWCLV